MDALELVIEVAAPEDVLSKEEQGSLQDRPLLSLQHLLRDAAAGEPSAPISDITADVQASDTQADPTPKAPTALAATPAAGSAVVPAGLASVAAALAGEDEPDAPSVAWAATGTAADVATPTVVAAAAGSAVAAAGASPAAPTAGGEEDELAANLLSNMAAWQTELETFQVALRQCMESRPVPGAIHGSPSTVDETGRGAARLLHSGPKGITGFRGVTQHKRTKRYEANVWMDHKQMYLGAFDVPEQAAHAHDIGALCSGKARTEALNFPLTDYDKLLPMLYSLPHAQVVSSLRGYGRLPTARPPGGISSGRLYSSPSARTSTARRSKDVDTDDSDDDGAVAPPKPRPRRQRKAALQAPLQQQQLFGVKSDSNAQQQDTGGSGDSWLAAGTAPVLPLPDVAAVAVAGDQTSVAVAQQAQLHALSAALMGTACPASPASSGAAAEQQQPAATAAADAVAAPRPQLPVPSRASLLLGPVSSLPLPAVGEPPGFFESVLWQVMATSNTLARPEDSQQGPIPRPLHSGPKGQSGFKGVTLYKRCQRYNAHIWLGKQTHIGTFHTAEQAAVAHDVMELWRNEAVHGLNFAYVSYAELLPLLKNLTEADALAALRNYSRSPSAAAVAATAGNTGNMPGRSRLVGMQRQAPSGGGSIKLAAAAPSAGATSAPPLPSLRRRQRKPQHATGGMAGNKSDDSSGGSVPPQRQSAGSLMWYMLEQEKSAEDDEFCGDAKDSDFSPEDAEEEQAATKRHRSESPTGEPLSFHPRITPSLVAALSQEVPEDQAIVGARPPRAGSSHRWGIAISLRGQAAWFGRLDRQRAAVAADLSLIWRRGVAAASGEEDDKDVGTAFNVPSAGYEQDAVLMDQLRRVKTATQLSQFLGAVIPQDQPAAPGAAAAAAAAAALVAVPGRWQAAPAPQAMPAPQLATPGMLLGARKRKQQALLEEARAAKLLQTGAALAAKPAASDGEGGEQPEGLLAQAAAAVAQADTSNSGSMLTAMQLLLVAGKGGRLLQEVVAGWDDYPLMQQQDLFGTLQLPAISSDWEQLEGRLQVALDLASLF